MLLAEVDPKSRTHKGSLEFRRREISAMPLERRLRFCGRAAAVACSEEPRKNLITLSATDAINDRSLKYYLPGLRRRGFPRFFLNIHFSAEGCAFFYCDALRSNIAVHGGRFF